MRTREEALDFALSMPNTYLDTPFHDENWTVVRRRDNRKIFLCAFLHLGDIWLNVKCAPEWRHVWRDAFPGVLPAYHMNKEHWNSIVLDGSVPDDLIRQMIAESYDLVAPARRRRAGDSTDSQSVGCS